MLPAKFTVAHPSTPLLKLWLLPSPLPWLDCSVRGRGEDVVGKTEILNRGVQVLAISSHPTACLKLVDLANLLTRATKVPQAQHSVRQPGSSTKFPSQACQVPEFLPNVLACSACFLRVLGIMLGLDWTAISKVHQQVCPSSRLDRWFAIIQIVVYTM